MPCTGNGLDHCCHLGKYGVCTHLEENTVPGRRWACGLLVRYGSWKAMMATDAYAEVQSRLDEIMSYKTTCRDWPPPGKRCNGCGLEG